MRRLTELAVLAVLALRAWLEGQAERRFTLVTACRSPTSRHGSGGSRRTSIGGPRGHDQHPRPTRAGL